MHLSCANAWYESCAGLHASACLRHKPHNEARSQVCAHGFATLQVLNLIIASRETHTWYCAKFEDYPRHRRALLPYVW